MSNEKNVDDIKLKVRQLIGGLADITADRGGRIDISSAGPRYKVLIDGDREGLVRLALAIFDHVISIDESKQNASFVNHTFDENSKIQGVVLFTPSKTTQIYKQSVRPNLIRQLIKLIFS